MVCSSSLMQVDYGLNLLHFIHLLNEAQFRSLGLLMACSSYHMLRTSKLPPASQFAPPSFGMIPLEALFMVHMKNKLIFVEVMKGGIRGGGCRM